jgi:hypothetical protein
MAHGAIDENHLVEKEGSSRSGSLDPVALRKKMKTGEWRRQGETRSPNRTHSVLVRERRENLLEKVAVDSRSVSPLVLVGWNAAKKHVTGSSQGERDEKTNREGT